MNVQKVEFWLQAEVQYKRVNEVLQEDVDCMSCLRATIQQCQY